MQKLFKIIACAKHRRPCFSMLDLVKFLLFLTFSAVIFLPVVTFAATPPVISEIIWPASKFNNTTDLVVGIINILLFFAGAAAVFAIIYSGIMYITASGDVAKAEAARKNLTWAITGIILVLLSLAIVNWVIAIF